MAYGWNLPAVARQAGMPQFSPSDIADLGMWFSAKDDSTLNFNGDNISQWDDKSGNDNHASQGTASNQPKYVASAINSHPALQGYHTGSIVSTLNVAADAGLTLTNGFHFFFVGQRVADLGLDEAPFNSYQPAASFRTQIGASDDFHSLIVHDGATPSGTGLTGPVTVGTPFIWAGQYDPVSEDFETNLRHDGSTDNATGNHGLDVGPENFQLFSRGFSSTAFGGYIGEVLFYTRELDADEVTAIMAYLQGEWSVP